MTPRIYDLSYLTTNFAGFQGQWRTDRFLLKLDEEGEGKGAWRINKEGVQHNHAAC